MTFIITYQNINIIREIKVNVDDRSDLDEIIQDINSAEYNNVLSVMEVE